jgi:RimJ/RimL family protein N-acetyltransferase
MKSYLFKSSRLGFRNWVEEDLQELASMNCDPEVMRYFPQIYTVEESRQFLLRMQSHFNMHGYNYFAVDLLSSNNFVGFIGLCYQDYAAPFTPCVDIGWRLKRSAWGRGFATEGAIANLHFAYDELKLTSIFSIASMINTKSEKIMQKIGMEKQLIFDHPKLVDSDNLNPCVVYKINLPI